jgi:hypothetical protein
LTLKRTLHEKDMHVSKALSKSVDDGAANELAALEPSRVA